MASEEYKKKYPRVGYMGSVSDGPDKDLTDDEYQAKYPEKSYTVLLAQPGPFGGFYSWIVYVEARGPGEAGDEARVKQGTEDNVDVESYQVLAVFEGHQKELWRDLE